MTKKPRLHDMVRKPAGYPFPGQVRAIFKTRNGQERFVVEATGTDYAGMLHIFSGPQLQVLRASERRVAIPGDLHDLHYLATENDGTGKPLWAFVPPGSDENLDRYSANGWATWADGEGWRITEAGRAAISRTES